jgi:putative tricarboxylic transport membrane protein
MKLNDAILGLVILLGGLAIILQARTFQPTHGQAYGPDLFPTIIGAGFVLSGIVLIVSGWRARAAVGWVDFEGTSAGRLLDAALVLAYILAFILLAGRLGFVLTAGLGVWLLMVRFQGGKWLSSALIAVVVVLAVDWAFRTVLLVPLPQGVVLPRLPW